MDTFIIISTGFITGITTYLFGFGGGFVVVPFVYQILSMNSVDDPNIMHIAVATSTAVMIFNASYATYINVRKGLINSKLIIPIIYYIGIGAILGGIIAKYIPDIYIRALFIIYMIITILDCIFRKGFFKLTTKKEMSCITYSAGGMLIGCIATILGVGGSVMTVPLLRRHGNNMEHSVAAANPLTLPIAIAGVIIYSLSSSSGDKNGVYYIGYININILLILIASGAVGIFFAKKLPKIPDRLHTKIYISLLFIVTAAICI